MKRMILIAMIMVSIVLISGCTTQEESCSSPYSSIGTECCIDEDSNGVCDFDEIEEPEELSGDVDIEYSGCTKYSISESQNLNEGNIYLLVDISVLNKADRTISISPLYLNVIIDGVTYGYDSESFSDAIDIIPSVGLQYNEEAVGQLLFEIPEESASEEFTLEYKPIEYGSTSFSDMSIVYNPNSMVPNEC